MNIKRRRKPKLSAFFLRSKMLILLNILTKSLMALIPNLLTKQRNYQKCIRRLQSVRSEQIH